MPPITETLENYRQQDDSHLEDDFHPDDNRGTSTPQEVIHDPTLYDDD